MERWCVCIEADRLPYFEEESLRRAQIEVRQDDKGATFVLEADDHAEALRKLRKVLGTNQHEAEQFWTVQPCGEG